jgi:myo-inositol-1(or 4)-monophosphatase
MTSSDLELLVAAAREAGAVALKRRNASLEIERKADGSPVTSADLEIDRLLHNGLIGARPDYGWLSEESADSPDRLQAERVFVIDPIDGTRAYIRGQPWFAVSLAVVENGRPIAGVVFAPALDALYAAAIGAASTLNGDAIGASRTARLEGAAMLGEERAFKHPAWREPWPAMRIEQRNALALRMALVAAGTFDAAVTLSPKHEWDIAAGTLIAHQAGAVACDHKGDPFVFNSPAALCPSLVCAAPLLAPLILERTRPIDLAS